MQFYKQFRLTDIWGVILTSVLSFSSIYSLEFLLFAKLESFRESKTVDPKQK